MKSRGLPINEEATITSQTLAWLLQLELESTEPAWIATRTLVDVWAYGVLAAARSRQSDIESALLEQLSTTTERLLPDRYDVLFYLPPRIPLKADDARVDNEEFQAQTDMTIRSGLERWNVDYVEIDVIASDADERVSSRTWQRCRMTVPRNNLQQALHAAAIAAAAVATTATTLSTSRSPTARPSPRRGRRTGDWRKS